MGAANTHTHTSEWVCLCASRTPSKTDKQRGTALLPEYGRTSGAWAGGRLGTETASRHEVFGGLQWTTANYTPAREWGEGGCVATHNTP